MFVVTIYFRPFLYSVSFQFALCVTFMCGRVLLFESCFVCTQFAIDECSMAMVMNMILSEVQN